MPPFWNRTPQTVRPRLSYRASALFCLLVFAFTAIIVYWRGHKGWTAFGAPPTYTATGYLVQQLPPSSRAAPATSQPKRDARICLRETSDTPEKAVEAVKALAERQMRDGRAEWKGRVDARAMKARQIAEDARKACAEATSQLNAYTRQIGEAAGAGTLQAAVKPAATPAAMIDNPQWLDLQEQVSSLQRRYDELLVDRTPLHPAVQEVVARMAGLKERMAAVAQRIPASRENTSPAKTPHGSGIPTPADRPAEEGAVNVQNADAIARPDTKKWSELTAAVERARHARSEAELAEELALQARQAAPAIALEATEVVENPPPSNAGWRRMLATTLATGLLMALGFGSFTAGAGIEPPITNVAELEADLGVTVLGTVRAANASADSAQRIRRRSHLRRLLIALGLIVMCVCPVIALWGMAGW